MRLKFKTALHELFITEVQQCLIYLRIFHFLGMIIGTKEGLDSFEFYHIQPISINSLYYVLSLQESLTLSYLFEKKSTCPALSRKRTIIAQYLGVSFGDLMYEKFEDQQL